MKENRKLLKEVIKGIKRDMTDEDVLNLLADSKVSENPNREKDKYTVGQRAADAIAKFAGSWAFIFSFAGLLILWMLANVLLAAKAFDPYPFILLNLALSCVAAVQAPLIMMSQNRQEEKDRRRAENDYKVNLKTEIMIEDLYDKVNAIFALQKELLKELRLQNEGVNPAARQTQNTMTPHTQSIDPESTTAIEAVVQTATKSFCVKTLGQRPAVRELLFVFSITESRFRNLSGFIRISHKVIAERRITSASPVSALPLLFISAAFKSSSSPSASCIA